MSMSHRGERSVCTTMSSSRKTTLLRLENSCIEKCIMAVSITGKRGIHKNNFIIP